MDGLKVLQAAVLLAPLTGGALTTEEIWIRDPFVVTDTEELRGQTLAG